MAEVSVTQVAPQLFRGLCSRCGPLPYVWTDQRLATFDALGHATAHHSER